MSESQSQPATSLRPPPQLHIEIIEHIIHLSVFPFNPSAAQSSRSHLLAFCLVNSTWRAIAQRELFKNVHIIVNSSEVSRFATALRSMPKGVPERRGTVALDWTGPGESRAPDADYAEVFSGASQVWLANGLRLACHAELSRAPELTALHILTSPFHFAVHLLEGLRMPISRLSLLQPYNSDVATVLISPTVFPSLRELVLVDYYEGEGNPIRPFLPLSPRPRSPPSSSPCRRKTFPEEHPKSPSSPSFPPSSLHPRRPEYPALDLPALHRPPRRDGPRLPLPPSQLRPRLRRPCLPLFSQTRLPHQTPSGLRGESRGEARGAVVGGRALRLHVTRPGVRSARVRRGSQGLWGEGHSDRGEFLGSGGHGGENLVGVVLGADS